MKKPLLRECEIVAAAATPLTRLAVMSSGIATSLLVPPGLFWFSAMPLRPVVETGASPVK